ncbi:MAG: hypothetical protein DSY43_02765 [Gammaproteobacteria bacterium]|nr:MAG: hypothetical protein DSY43_02765 [Gammaproteobacteria bacterium]
MYWCAASTPDGNGDIIKAKWEILPLHIQDIHENNDNDLHPDCGHGELEGESREKQWIAKGGTFDLINQVFHIRIACYIIIAN